MLMTSICWKIHFMKNKTLSSFINQNEFVIFLDERKKGLKKRGEEKRSRGKERNNRDKKERRRGKEEKGRGEDRWG